MLRTRADVLGESRAGRGARADVAQALRRVVWQVGPFLVLAIVVVIFGLANPRFLTPVNLGNILRQAAPTALFAIGATMVILTGGIDLSVGSVAALSACVSAVLMTRPVTIAGMTFGPFDWITGLVVAVVVGAIVGAFNGLVITRGRIPDFIATLGTMTAVRGLAHLVTGGLPVPTHFLVGEVRELPAPLIWLGTHAVFGIPILGIIAVIVAIAIGLLLRYGGLGRSFYAIGGNREAARVSGIHVNRTKWMAYMLCGLIAGLSGYLITGRLSSANAGIASGEELQAIASVVIGGTNLFGGEGGVAGSLVGAVTIGAMRNGLNMAAVPTFWIYVIQGAVIIAVVVLDQWRRRRFRA